VPHSLVAMATDGKAVTPTAPTLASTEAATKDEVASREARR
jgi:hypothetical protein